MLTNQCRWKQRLVDIGVVAHEIHIYIVAAWFYFFVLCKGSPCNCPARCSASEAAKAHWHYPFAQVVALQHGITAAVQVSMQSLILLVGYRFTAHIVGIWPNRLEHL